MEVVTRVVGRVDKERRANLEKTVTAVHSLLVASRLRWKIRAVLYTVYGGNEVLWTVSGVWSAEEDEQVIGEIRHEADTAWWLGLLMDPGSRKKSRFMLWLGGFRKGSGLVNGVEWRDCVGNTLWEIGVRGARL